MTRNRFDVMAENLRDDMSYAQELAPGDHRPGYDDLKQFLVWRGVRSSVIQANVIRVAGLKGYIRLLPGNRWEVAR